MPIKSFTTITLLAFHFILNADKAHAQDTISIHQDGYELKQTADKAGRTQAFSKPGNIPLQKGIYKNIDLSRYTVFCVSDSGYDGIHYLLM